MRATIGVQFAARSAEGGPLGPLIEEFGRTIRPFGFAASMCGAWIGAGRARASRRFFIDWPQDWAALYEARGFFEKDFIVAEARRRMSPFLWADIRGERKLTRAEAEVAAAMQEYGWIDVFAVPVHGPAGYQGLVSMASRRPCTLTAADCAALRIMALAIHDRCLADAGLDNAGGKAPRLTDREIECLRWVATGKSDREIASALGISAATAHYHIERAKKRLGARSRAEAVASLVFRGEL